VPEFQAMIDKQTDADRAAERPGRHAQPVRTALTDTVGQLTTEKDTLLRRRHQGELIKQGILAKEGQSGSALGFAHHRSFCT